MISIEFPEFVQFVKQAGFALSGAAALWGFVFSLKSSKKKQNNSVVWEWLTRKFIYLLYGGIAITFLGWTVQGLTSPMISFAHEGIAVIPTALEYARAYVVLLPLMAAWLIFTLVTLYYHLRKPQILWKNINSIYFAHFVVIFVAMSIPAITSQGWAVQAFFAGHSFHSVFTLGTVLVLDFLVLISNNKPVLQQLIFPFFPTISKVIWLGLAFDFASVLLIFGDIQSTLNDPRFFFIQTVVAILIMNGVMLSGPITRRMKKSLEEDGDIELSKRWQDWANIAGVISITSWLSITFWDYFPETALQYWHFMLIYIGMMVVLHVGHVVFERMTKNHFRYIH